MTIRVVLADDHRVVREGLRRLLEREEDVVVVGTVDDGQHAVEIAAEVAPDIVVMDVSMPGMNGIEATRRITGGGSGTKVLCLSMHAERQMVLEALRAGASGYLLKESSGVELVCALRTLAEGRKYISPAIAGIVVEALTSDARGGAGSPGEALTSREREVLQLLAEGHSTKQIAIRLNVSAKTVSSHREHVMHKLDIESIAGLTKYAIRHGLTTVDR